MQAKSASSLSSYEYIYYNMKNELKKEAQTDRQKEKQPPTLARFDDDDDDASRYRSRIFVVHLHSALYEYIGLTIGRWIDANVFPKSSKSLLQC